VPYLTEHEAFEYTCTTLQHPDCKDEQRLLDAYLRALDEVAAIHRCNAPQDPRTLKHVWAELVAARDRYWTHVSKHGCRKTGASTPEV
jgi:hypothetical protein